MPKINKSYYDFHIVIDSHLKKQLQSRSIFRNIASFSGTVVKILCLMYPRLEKEHFSMKQKFSRYQPVTTDPNTLRCSVHIYMPPDLYRRLKLIHHDLNFYSIGQLIRWLLRLFLQWIAAAGTNIKQKLSKQISRYRKDILSAQLPHEISRQMSHFFNSTVGNLHLLNIYNRDAVPVKIYKF